MPGSSSRLTKNSDHAGPVQNDGGNDEGEEGEGEEDPVGHCVVLVGLACRHRSPGALTCAKLGPLCAREVLPIAQGGSTTSD